MNTASILWTLIFGSIGLGLFLYGRKQHAGIPLVCGLSLMVLPYLVEAPLLLATLGIALVAIPFAFRS